MIVGNLRDFAVLSALTSSHTWQFTDQQSAVWSSSCCVHRKEVAAKRRMNQNLRITDWDFLSNFAVRMRFILRTHGDLMDDWEVWSLYGMNGQAIEDKVGRTSNTLEKQPIDEEQVLTGFLGMSSALQEYHDQRSNFPQNA
ncbi:hypothetical protein KIN20_020744 [Parelaphostrongylus tenuis]|uniref:Uncharacterized protein n=1 Tax=Parelaphostrongylus tenuis TaxID=148309 RepID=A0AAD5MMX0_PARTN|nr:hypothetical protein KIN20_020744 [Parelaphostrongylus tenuis]